MKMSVIYETVFNVLQEGSLDLLCREAYRIMGMPITITDSAYVVVGIYSPVPTQDAQWETNTLGEQIITEAIIAYQNDQHWPILSGVGGATCIDWGYYKGAPRYAAYIMKKNDVLGSLAFLIGDQPMEDWHLDAVNIFAKAAALLMSRNHQSKQNAPVLKELLLKSLMLNTMTSAQFKHMAKMAHFTIADAYVLVGLGSRNLGNSMFTEFLFEEARRYLPEVLMVEDGLYLYMLSSSQNISLLETKLKNIQKKLREEDDITICVSEVLENPLELARFKEQVDALLKLTRTCSITEPVLYYEKYRDLVVIDIVASHFNVKNLLHPTIQKIKDYDQKYHSDLLVTLQVYCYLFQNKKKTTEVLNIHRNTLYYRLDKIEEIGEFSFENDETVRSFMPGFSFLQWLDIQHSD